MRTRRRDTVQQVSISRDVYILDFNNWGRWKFQGSDTPTMVEFPSESRVITDEATRPNKSVNVVDHFVGKLVFGEHRITSYGSGTFYKFYQSPGAQALGILNTGTIPNNCGLPTAGEWDALVQEGFEKLAKQAGLAQINQTLPFIGELHKTVHMLRHPLEFLSKMPNRAGLRKLTLGGALRQLGFGPASDAWLTYKYGWKPLMSDLSDFAKSFSTCARDYDTYKAAKHSGRVFFSQTTRNISSRRSPDATPNGWWWEATDNMRLRAFIWGRLRPDGPTKSILNFVLDRFGITPRNLITTSWELIPYSFVVDWFIPVGNTLSKINSTQSLFELEKTQFDLQSNSQVDYLYSYNGSFADGYSNEAAYRQHVARVTGKWYLRQTKPLTGDYGNDWTFSNNHVVTALALIGQRLKLPI